MELKDAELCKAYSNGVNDNILALITLLDDDSFSVEHKNDIKIILANILSVVNYDLPPIIYAKHSELDDRYWGCPR